MRERALVCPPYGSLRVGLGASYQCNEETWRCSRLIPKIKVRRSAARDVRWWASHTQGAGGLLLAN